MLQALATTKLRPPKTRPKLVLARPRLREALAAGEGRPLALVSAPAGFGETTLLGEWSERLAGEGKSVAWVSPERSDKDPAGFLSHLTGALWEVEESFGEDVLAALDVPQLPPVEAPVGAIVNGLDETRTEVVLVLDVYRVVDSGLVHDTVVLLLRHLPENALGDLRERSSLFASRVLTCKSSENKEPTSGLEPLVPAHYE